MPDFCTEIYSSPGGAYYVGCRRSSRSGPYTLTIGSTAGGPLGTIDSPTFSGLGRRVAIDQIGDEVTLVSADYHEGVAGYDVHTAEQIWSRRDLKSVQALQSCVTKPLVCVEFNRGFCCFLDFHSGRTVPYPLCARSHRCFFGRSEFVLLIASRNTVARKDLRNNLECDEGKRITKGVLHGDFCIASWLGGPIVGYQASDGTEVGRFDPGEGYRSVAIGKNADSLWIYNQGRCIELGRRMEVIQEVPTITGAPIVLPYQDLLLTNNLDVIDLKT